MKSQDKKAKLEKRKPVQKMQPDNLKTPKELSDYRIKTLNDAIFEMVDKVAEHVQGDFTLAELTHVFTRVTFTYNKRALDQQQEFGLELRKDPNEVEVNEQKEL